MFLNDPFPGAFGLDIGDNTLKLVQLRKTGGYGKPRAFEVVAMRSASLTPGAIVHGEIMEPETVRKKIISLLQSNPPIRSPWVVCDLPEAHTFLKFIEIAKQDAELTYDDVSFHASKHLPFAIEETYLDWQMIPAEPGRDVTGILVGAVPKVIADSYTYLLEAAGLNPLALEIEAISLVRTMITDNKDYTGEARAILDLGSARSSLVIFDKNTIQFSLHLNFSAQKMNEKIAAALHISLDEADKLRIAKGFSYVGAKPAYVTAFDAVVMDLVSELKRAFQFYQEHFTDPNPITRIVMCGGMAQSFNLDTVLSQKMKIATAPGNPWKNVSMAMGESKREKGLLFASAIGLSLRAARNPLQNEPV